MNVSRKMIRELRRDNLAYPAHLVPIPRSAWPVGTPSDRERIAVFRSRHFLAQAFDEVDGIVRLTVNRTDWDANANRWRDDISWDDLQRIKNEAGFPDCDAVEIYPEQSSVVNVANMRHLWILPDRISFAWRSQDNAKG